MRPLLTYALFIVAVVACGLLIGINNIPGEWYQSLQKPPFNPPNWIFAPVWTTLYVIIGYVGARTFLQDRRSRGVGLWRSRAMRFWGAQMLFNFAWSPLFFGFHEIALALIFVLALLISVYAFIAVSWRQDRLSAWLFMPYAAWVSFATLLNGSILLLN